MQSIRSRQPSTTSRILAPAIALTTVLLLGCASSAPQKVLPPSASDLRLFEPSKICDPRARVLATREAVPSARLPWGEGEEIRFSTQRETSSAQEAYFFDEDGVFVGYLLAFPEGLPLTPFPVLRETLTQLPPTLEFYLSLAGLPKDETPETTTIYMTGDEKSTTQYLLQGKVKAGRLLIATLAIDPYVQLFSPYRRELLARLTTGTTRTGSARAPGPGSEDQDPFVSLQQFARGETALLGYCGNRDETLAAAAYQKAIQHGFSSKPLLAEAHHKLGLTWKAMGDLERARRELQQSLVVRPDRPDVLNNLGHVYHQMGRGEKAIETFTKAVALRPNYPIARFNLAEAFEKVDRRRAIEEYETYLALAEDVPEEAERTRRARERVDLLTR